MIFRPRPHWTQELAERQRQAARPPMRVTRPRIHLFDRPIVAPPKDPERR